MRSRILNQIPKALRTSPTTGASCKGKTPSSQSQTIKTIIQQRQTSSSSASMQQRLFGTNTIRLTRSSLGVEGCSTVLSVINGVVVEPNLPRGWDAGVAVDDDGG